MAHWLQCRSSQALWRQCYCVCRQCWLTSLFLFSLVDSMRLPRVSGWQYYFSAPSRRPRQHVTTAGNVTGVMTSVLLWLATAPSRARLKVLTWRSKWRLSNNLSLISQALCYRHRVQELCESWDGRPGPPSLIVRTVSVDVKQHSNENIIVVAIVPVAVFQTSSLFLVQVN